ncbi:helix-turn-helix domain-containing protein [Brucella pituitosa]|uniref:helix-turn-helix domain-containing protein n=1 Tax=Brucella pituitosa TaxID=571256 RepID=UPI000CFEEBDE|nr:helix-turn-helix domain-containing protein [Ochrobactrum sp. MYb68]
MATQAASSDDFTRSRMTWLDQVFDDPELTPVARDVAFRISRYFNRKGFSGSGNLNAWPSHETLANASGCSAKTIQRAILLLKAQGHLSTKGKGGRAVSLTYFAVFNGGQKGGHERPPLTEKVDTSVPKGGHLKPEKVDTRVQQTSLNKSLNKSLNANRAGDPADDAFKAGWALAIFDELSKQPTQLPRPRTALLRNLIEVEKRPALVMEHQARHGWPEVNRMFDEPKALTPAALVPAVRGLVCEMEAVIAGSALWGEWQSEFEKRGWPFPCEAQSMAFPRSGPRGLDAFMNALRARQAGAMNVRALAVG